jgi:hypothetical protein
MDGCAASAAGGAVIRSAQKRVCAGQLPCFVGTSERVYHNGEGVSPVTFRDVESLAMMVGEK